jgi:hypothetical protein
MTIGIDEPWLTPLGGELFKSPEQAQANDITEAKRAQRVQPAKRAQRVQPE